MAEDTRKHEIERLITILDKPKNTRTSAECSLIYDFLRTTSPVSNLKDDDVMQLCQVATHVSIRDVDDVFHQDDPPDAFYIIMSGHIIVTKRLETGFVRLQPGDGFGQLGILKKTPRSATCTAEGQTELIRVSAEDYERLFEQQHERELSERVAFLKDISVLRHLTDEEVKLMAEVMTEQHFAPNKVIITEGDDASSMYFIVSGKASIVMTIVYKGIPRFVEVTRIGVNDYFGELALLNSVPRSASVVAHVPLTCLVLSRIDFGRFIAGSTLQAMKEASKRYVSREEITRLFVEKQHWDQYKKRLVSDIVDHHKKTKSI